MTRPPRNIPGLSGRTTTAAAALVIGLVVAGAVVLIVTSMTPGDPPNTPAPPVAHSSPPTSASDPAADADACLATAGTVRTLSDAIAAAGRKHSSAAVDAAFTRADAEMSKPLGTSNPQLARAFTDLIEGMHTLRAATTANLGVGAATDNLLRLIDEIDQTCHAVLLAPISATRTQPVG